MEAGDFCAGEPGDRGERVLIRPACQPDGKRYHTGGDSVVLLLQKPTVATKARRDRSSRRKLIDQMSSWSSTLFVPSWLRPVNPQIASVVNLPAREDPHIEDERLVA